MEKGMTQIEMKKIIQHALESNDLDDIVSIARRNRGALSLLVRMAYDKETLVGWRAIMAIGSIAKVLVKTDYEFLRETVRKLLWTLSDESGGIGWAAPEILGEIVNADPDKFSEIIPLIAEVYDVEEQVFRPGVVYALARIAQTAPERVAVYEKIIVMSLVSEDSLMKVYALDLVGYLWQDACLKNSWNREYRHELINSINNMKNDHGVAWIYNNGGFIDIEVGEKAKIVAEMLI